MSDNYTAILDEELSSHTIAHQHLGHALKAIVLFILDAGIAILWENAVEAFHPSLPIFWTGNAFCLLIFWVTFVAWYHGAEHIDALSKEYRAEKKHQRDLQRSEQDLREKQLDRQLKLLKASQGAQLAKAPELPSMTLGRNLHVADPMQHSDVRVEVIPPRDYLVWQWTKGYEKRGEKRIPWGEERAERVWGAESDRWLEQLAIIGFIEGRSADKKKPGALTHELPEVLDYFNHPPLLSPIRSGSTPEASGSRGSSSQVAAG